MVCQLMFHTAWNISKYGVFSGSYFPVFSLNAGKYGPEKTPYLDTFHTVPVLPTFTFAPRTFESMDLYSFTIWPYESDLILKVVVEASHREL